MPRCCSSAPRKKLPPPMTTAICAPVATTSAICRATVSTTVGVDADGPAAEHLAAELEQHAAEAGGRDAAAGACRRRSGWRPRDQAWPTSKRAKSLTVTPASSSRALTVFFGSWTDGCSSSTTSLK